MKAIKALLLGFAAAVIGAAGSQGADLPTRKAAPVEYVRICSVFGPGYFYIPGSDTCIKLSGHVRAEYAWLQTYTRGDQSNYRMEARLGFDAMTQTDFGPLHTNVNIDLRRQTGSGWFGSGTSARGGYAIQFWGPAGGFPSYSGVDTVNQKLQTYVNVYSAFVQWGGLTAGRLQSFFDFYAGNDTWFGIGDSNIITQALAYTYTFGSGFSATLSIEDPKERQRFPVAGLAPVGSGGINPSVPSPPFTNVFPFAFSPWSAPAIFGAPLLGPVATPTVGSISYVQRESIPDVVGQLHLTQGWGEAQLSAAYHRVSTVGGTIINLTPTNGAAPGFVQNPLVPTVPGGFGALTGNGWAVLGGVKVLLPMIAEGDHIFFEAGYAKGGIGYINSDYPGMYSAGGMASTYDNYFAYDAVVGPTGRMRLTPAWNALVSFQHYWTPSIRQAVFGSVVDISYGSGIRTAAGFAAGAACPTCIGTVFVATPGGPTPYNAFSNQYDAGKIIYLGSNLIWSPLKNFDIGVEVSYARDELAHKQWDGNRGAGLLLKNADLWLMQMRVIRNF
jgi:hypothetical protein